MPTYGRLYAQLSQPPKIGNELCVPSDRHLVAVAGGGWWLVAGGGEKISTCKILRLIYAQLDQPTHSFLPSASQSP